MRTVTTRSEVELIYVPAKAAVFSRIPYLVETLFQHIPEGYAGYAFLPVVDITYVGMVEVVARPDIAVPANESNPAFHESTFSLALWS